MLCRGSWQLSVWCWLEHGQLWSCSCEITDIKPYILLFLYQIKGRNSVLTFLEPKIAFPNSLVLTLTILVSCFLEQWEVSISQGIFHLQSCLGLILTQHLSRDERNSQYASVSNVTCSRDLPVPKRSGERSKYLQCSWCNCAETWHAGQILPEPC